MTAQKSAIEVTGISRGDVPDDVLTSAEPLLLKGLVADWPMVEASRESTQAGVDYLRSFYKNATVGSFIGPPGGDGRVFYNADMTGFNYQRVMLKLDQILDKILEHEGDPSAVTNRAAGWAASRAAVSPARNPPSSGADGDGV